MVVWFPDTSTLFYPVSNSDDLMAPRPFAINEQSTKLCDLMKDRLTNYKSSG